MSQHRKWTAEDDEYLCAAFGGKKKPPLEEVAQHLGRPIGGVRDRAQSLGITWSPNGRKARWTPEEDEMLEASWGQYTIEGIAARLGRSLEATKKRVQDLGLGAYTDNGAHYLVWRQLIQAVYGYPDGTVGGQCRAKRRNWLKKGLPVYEHSISARKSVWVIRPEAWWKWAEAHQELLDFSCFEAYTLGPEPDWVAGKRRRDCESRRKIGKSQSNAPWSQWELNKLKDYINQQKYCADELAELMGRTTSSVRNAVRHLGLTHLLQLRDRNSWDKGMLDQLSELVHTEDNWPSIAEKLGMPEPACYEKAKYTYGTMRLGELRNIVKKGDWGAITETWKGLGIGKCKKLKPVREGVSQLIAILKVPIEREGSKAYWQSSMCEHWNPWKGCAMGEAECDSCLQFQRIKPKYCEICGAEFVRRGGNAPDLCPTCQAKSKAEQTKQPESIGTRQGLDSAKTAAMKRLIAEGKKWEQIAGELNVKAGVCRAKAVKTYGTSSLKGIREKMAKKLGESA